MNKHPLQQKFITNQQINIHDENEMIKQYSMVESYTGN